MLFGHRLYEVTRMKFWFIVISLRPLLVDKRVSSVVAVVVECVLIDFVGIFFSVPPVLLIVIFT